jgi:hypothetical protein
MMLEKCRQERQRLVSALGAWCHCGTHNLTSELSQTSGRAAGTCRNIHIIEHKCSNLYIHEKSRFSHLPDLS